MEGTETERDGRDTESTRSPWRPLPAGAQENRGMVRGEGTGTETGVPRAELSRPAPWRWMAPGQSQPELIRDEHHTCTCAQPQLGQPPPLSTWGEQRDGPHVGCLTAPPGRPRPCPGPRPAGQALHPHALHFWLFGLA